MLEIIRMSVLSLWGHKLRAVLTTLGITIGVFTVGSVTAIIEGLNSSFANQISSLGSDVFYVSRHSWFSGYEGWIKSQKRKIIDIDTGDYIYENAKLVEVTSPMIRRRVNLKYEDKSMEAVEITGVNQMMPIIEGTEISQGRFFSGADVRHRKNVVVIGENVRKEFFPDRPAVGQKIYIKGQKFLVIGLFEKKGKMLFNDLDNRVQIPYLTFKKII